MNVNLYHNTSDNNRLNKSITVIGFFSGSLRSESSVLEPSILIKAANLSGANYMQIPDFGRYYYITDVVSVRTGLWLIRGHVDVLMTYASGIRSCGAVLARSETEYNLYLDDDRFLINAQRQFVCKAFPNRAPEVSEGSSFVVTIAG